MAIVKNILTFEQLLEFCKKHKFEYFNSNDSGYRLAVKVPTIFEEVDSVDENHRGMMKIKIRIFHTGLNRNGSYVSEESAKKAMKTISDRPVLAAIHQLDDGTWDFEGHEMEYVPNQDGDLEIKYIESQVGSFSSEEPFWEHDDELDKDYVCAYAYISEEYTKAAEIIRAKNGTKNSCELFIDEMSYNAKEKYLDLKEFFVNASTLLGSKSDGTEIGEGMLGSRADIVEFSEENNSIKYQKDDKLLETLEKLNNTLSKLTIDNLTRKEETTKVENESIIEETTDEEVVIQNSEEETDSTEELDEPITDEEEIPEDTQDVTPNVEESTDDVVADSSVKCSISYGEKSLEYSVSVSEIVYALSELVNDTYADENAYYGIEVYIEDKYVIMTDWWSGKSYKQSYKVKKDTYSLVGDRIPVKAIYVTEDEEKELDKMRSNYSSISEKLEKYESEPEKTEILNSVKYKYVYNTEEFSELIDDHFDLTIEELTTKANEILFSYAEKGALKFEETTPTVTKRLPVGKVTKKENRYGDIFSK